MHALIAKKKIGLIDDTIEEPSQDANSTEFELWNQCNNMIISWLTHSVEADITEGIIHAKTAHQVWVDLHDQFSQKECSSNFSDTKVDSNDVTGNHDTVSIFHQAQSTLG